MRPRRAILTNLHTDLDYETLRRRLPRHVVPAYDGMRIEAILISGQINANANVARDRVVFRLDQGDGCGAGGLEPCSAAERCRALTPIDV